MLTALLGESILTLGGTGLQIGLIVASQSLVARLLGQAGVGILGLLLTVPATIVAGLNMGLALSNLYLGAGAPSLRPKLATLSFALAAILGTGLGAAILGAKAAIVGWFADVSPSMVTAMAIGLPGMFLLSYCGSFLLGMHMVLKYNLLATARAAGLFITLVALVGLGVLSLDLLPVAWLSGVGVAVVFATIWTVLAVDRLQRPDWKLFTRSFRYGIKGDIANLFTQLNYRAGLYFITLTLGTKEAGTYVAAASVSDALGYLASAIATVLPPRIAASDSARELTPVVCRLMLVSVSAGALLVGLAAGGIVQVVFGPGFGLTVIALRWMLPGVVARTGARILSADLIGRGKTEYNLLTSMAGFGVTLLTFPVLIQPFGVVGAAAGATTVYTVIFLLSLIWYGRETHRQFKELAIVVLPQRKDWHLARELFGSFMASARRRKL